MKNEILLLAAILSIAVGVSGCATTMTMMSPVTSEVVVAEKRLGAFEKYDYAYQVKDNSILLTRTPMCNEMARSVRVDRKRTIGYGPAMIEMAFFGMGLLDIASASAVSEASRKVFPLAEYDTGNLLTCGEPEPAAGEVLVIESKKLNADRLVVTDEHGRIDLESVIGRTRNSIPLTIRLASDESLAFTCLYRAPSDQLRGPDLAYLVRSRD